MHKLATGYLASMIACQRRTMDNASSTRTRASSTRALLTIKTRKQHAQSNAQARNRLHRIHEDFSKMVKASSMRSRAFSATLLLRIKKKRSMLTLRRGWGKQGRRGHDQGTHDDEACRMTRGGTTHDHRVQQRVSYCQWRWFRGGRRVGRVGMSGVICMVVSCIALQANVIMMMTRPIPNSSSRHGTLHP
jgi:hypothetical protein